VLIVLAHSSRLAQRNRYVSVWIENATQVSFPNWHFRIPRSSPMTFVSRSCHFSNGSIVNTDPCEPWHGDEPPIDKCFSVQGHFFNAVQDVSIPMEGQRIACEFQTTGQADYNDMVAWELEGFVGIEGVGPNAHSLWLAPNNFTWVLIQKSTMKYHGQKNLVDEWEKTLIYHSPTSLQGFYFVETILGSFDVTHFEEQNLQNGWETIGQIGGYIYFMLIIHTLVIIFFGFCLDNNSRFLNNESNE